MQVLFSVFLDATLYGSVMILLALLLRPILRKAPRRILCFLWLFVMARLLLPIPIESKLSLQPRFTATQTIVDQVPETPYIPPAQDPVVPTPVIPSPPDVTLPVERVWELKDMIPALWFVVMCVTFTYMAISYSLLRYRLRDAVPSEKGVWETNRIPGAFMLGYLRPQIYLPTDLDPADRQLILAHEKAHIRRGDAWWKLLGMFCLCIHWYNPLVWLAYWLMSRDIETACDERVIHAMPLAQRKAYSYALLNSGKRLSGIFASPVAFAEINLRQRIKKVLSYRNPGIWITIAAIAISVCIIVFFMTDPVPEQRSSTGPDRTPSTQSTEHTKSTVGTDHTHIWQPATCTAPKICTICNAAEGEKLEHTIVKRKCTLCGALLPSEELRFMRNADGKSYRCDNYLGTDPNVVIPGDYNGLPVTQVGRLGNSCPVLIILPDSITVIEGSAFQHSPRLASITLPSGLTTIGQFAFTDCPALETITLPATVTSIGEGAFQNCTQLKSIYFAGTMAQWNAITKGNGWNSADLDKDKVLESTIPAAGVTCSDGFVPF